MAFSKKTYTSGQTTITADNLNAIQDELIRVGGSGTLPVADYVVAQGTSGNWTYRKWNSGIAECWASKNCGNVAITEAWGSLYEGTECGQEAYPSGLFRYKPLFWASVLSTDRYAVGGLEIDGGDANTTPHVYPLRATSGTVQGLILSFYAKGYWK